MWNNLARKTRNTFWDSGSWWDCLSVKHSLLCPEMRIYSFYLFWSETISLNHLINRNESVVTVCKIALVSLNSQWFLEWLRQMCKSVQSSCIHCWPREKKNKSRFGPFKELQLVCLRLRIQLCSEGCSFCSQRSPRLDLQGMETSVSCSHDLLLGCIRFSSAWFNTWSWAMTRMNPPLFFCQTFSQKPRCEQLFVARQPYCVYIFVCM